MNDTFGTTPEDFDLDAWIEAACRPSKTVMVYRDWGLMDELSRLEGEIEAAEQVTDRSMGDPSPEALREEYAGVVEKLTASALPIKLQHVTTEERATISQAVAKGEDGKRDPFTMGRMILAEATVEPKLTYEQIVRMHEKLGDGPMEALYDAMNELASAGKVLPEVPFSRES